MFAVRLGLTFLILLFAVSGCCVCGGGGYVAPEGRVYHVVLCWLKDAGNAEQRAEIVRVSRTFTRIPGVRHVAAGPVVPSDRKIVDSTFDVGIVLTFDTVEDMQTYLVHPRHQEAVKQTLRPLVRKILVYDFHSSPHLAAKTTTGQNH